MKNLMIATLMLSTFHLTTFGQTTTSSKEKLKPFEVMIGNWKGEGSMQMGPGEPKKSLVEEKVEAKLDGTIIVVEGTGTDNGSIVHQAMGIISFDYATGQYEFKTYLKDGRNADAWFNVVGENKFQWGFEFSKGKMRYSISIDPVNKTWNEIGEYSQDGNTWYRNLEMNLKKV